MDEMTSLKSPLQNGFFPSMNDELSPNFKQFHLNIQTSTSPSINGFRFTYPPVPFSTIGEQILPDCPSTCLQPPDCFCTQRLNIPMESIVEITITAYAESVEERYYHPVHIHGNAFFVIAFGYGTHQNSSAADPIVNNPAFICDPDSPLCSKTKQVGELMDFNYINPPKRTTVLVPTGGYVVLRFKADNPGMWPMHCHVMSHSLSGEYICRGKIVI